jgi:peptidoglycan/LPS O-acetylase OafA/YrhL
MFRTKNVWNYLGNRAARIYPAFAVSYLICVVLVAPLLGERPWHLILHNIANLFFLKPPPLYTRNIFRSGTIALNGAMWSISYEFKCYIVVAIFWSIGILRDRRIMFGLSFLGLFASVISTFGVIPSSFNPWIPRGDLIIGSPTTFIRLIAIFSVGVTSFLYKTELIRLLDWRVAIVAATALAATMFERNFAELSFTLLGGYCIFWFAFDAKIGVFQRINDGWDISYGLYLYGWPSAVYLLHLWPRGSLLLMTVTSLALATIAGTASWFGVEKWVKDPFGKRIAPLGHLPKQIIPDN